MGNQYDIWYLFLKTITESFSKVNDFNTIYAATICVFVIHIIMNIILIIMSIRINGDKKHLLKKCFKEAFSFSFINFLLFSINWTIQNGNMTTQLKDLFEYWTTIIYSIEFAIIIMWVPFYYFLRKLIEFSVRNHVLMWIIKNYRVISIIFKTISKILSHLGCKIASDISGGISDSIKEINNSKNDNGAVSNDEENIK
jgi:hypothetical protein